MNETVGTAGTLAPSATAVPPPPMIHKEGYFTAAYAIVIGGILVYLISIFRRFPKRPRAGA